jgi:hypothetical protein
VQRRQALAALGAASFQNGAAVLGRHACAKPVLFGASAIVWLKGSLRHCRSPSNSLESENLKFIENAAKCQSEMDMQKPDC